MTKLLKPLIHFLLIACVFISPAIVRAQLTDQEPEIGIIEKLNTYLPEDILLLDENFDTVYLQEIIDKPTVISFVYFRCPGICTPLMDGLANVIEKTTLVPGEDYQVLTISFDPTESSDLAARKKRNYMNLIENKDIAEGWHFYTSDSANIARLTEATGFRYKRTGNDFLHAGALILVSPDGKITRYLNGTYFLPFEFKMAIVEATQGKTGPTINKVLQYCYTYDPAGQQYVLNITKVSGSIIIFIGLLFFLVLALKPVFRKKESK